MLTSNYETRASYKNAVRICQLQIQINQIISMFDHKASIPIDGHVGSDIIDLLNAFASDKHGYVIDLPIDATHWEYSVKYLQEWVNAYISKSGLRSTRVTVDNVYSVYLDHMLNYIFRDITVQYEHYESTRELIRQWGLRERV